MSFVGKQVFFEKYVFEVCADVYEPAEDSFFFARNLVSDRDDCVLDMGTGCGILAIVAAGYGSNVVAVDVNPFAVHCALANARRNGVSDRISVIRGDLLRSVAETRKFDLILFNSPYVSVNRESDSWLEYAWAAGASRKQVVDQFIVQAIKHLKHDGQILLLQSTLSGGDGSVPILKNLGLDVQFVGKLDLPFFETLVLIRASRR